MNWNIFNKKQPKGKPGLYKELAHIIELDYTITGRGTPNKSWACTEFDNRTFGLSFYGSEIERERIHFSLRFIEQEKKKIKIEFWSKYTKNYNLPPEIDIDVVFYVSEDDNIYCNNYNEHENSIHKILSFLEKLMCKLKEKEEIINNPINRMAKDILYRLGYWSGGNDEDIGNISYNFDDLHIDDKHIYYNKVAVFKINHGIIKHGAWERLLLEIYNHIDELEERKRQTLNEIKRKEKEGYDYFKNIYKRFPKIKLDGIRKSGTHDATKTIENVARLRTKLKIVDESADERGIYYYYTYEILKYDETSNADTCVLRVSNVGEYLPDCKLDYFIPGVWQEELLRFFHNEDLKEEREKLKKEQERLKTETESVEKSILKLLKK